MQFAEMEVNKAKNLMVHEKEIYSRPAKVWFQKGNKRSREGGEHLFILNG